MTLEHINTLINLSHGIYSLAQRMEKTIEEEKDSLPFAARAIILAFANELKLILSKANMPTDSLPDQGIKEDAKRRFEREDTQDDMVEVLAKDGSSLYVAIDPSMPIGAKTIIEGMVYVFKDDRKLHFDERETGRVIALRAGKPI